MISAWLIYDEKSANLNKSFIDWFILEAEQQQIQLKLILRENLQIGVFLHQPTIFYKSEKVNLPEIAIVRTIDPLLSKQLESIGIHVFNNSEVASICNHKALSHQYLSKFAIPMLDTYFYQKSSLRIDDIPLPFPFVIKNVAGKGGKEVFYVKDKTDWDIVQDKLANEVIIQPTNVQLGKDLRVYVIGNKIIAAVLRESNTNFKANFSLGGNARLYELNKEEEARINQIITKFDFDFVGIDFLLSKDGQLLFNEIEDVVGSRMLSKITDINVLEKYVAHIVQKYRKNVGTK